jgi:ADP-heptose:LPS heptosyltransferase
MSEKSILVYVGADCIGDAIQKIPYINAIRKGFPQHKIVWFANMGSVFKGLLKDIGDEILDEVISDINFTANLSDIFKNPFGGTPLEGREFDYIFDTQKRWKQTLILKKIKHKHFVSGCADFLFSDIKPKRGYKPARNVTKRLIEMTSIITGETYSIDYSVPLPQRFTDEAHKLLPPGQKYMGFVPCGSVDRKKWPLRNYIQLAKKYQQTDFRPVFILGPEEQVYKDEILAAIPEAVIPGVMVISKEDNIHGPLYYMALGQQLTAIVANDCGPGHLLNCANRPTIFLFGPTDAEKFAPERDGVTVLKSADWGSESLQDIPFEAVDNVLLKAICGVVEPDLVTS